MLFGVPAPGPFVLTMYKITLPHGYFFTWFFHGFFFRSSLTGIFNVVFAPLFFTWSTPPPHFYTSRYLVKLRMKLAAPWYVQGGQMGENVAAAALRQPGSETLHVFGLGRGLAMARAWEKARELAEQVVWAVRAAVSSWAAGRGGVVRLVPPACLVECDRASTVELKRYLISRRF